jgi:chromosome segregation ATPase
MADWDPLTRLPGGPPSVAAEIAEETRRLRTLLAALVRQLGGGVLIPANDLVGSAVAIIPRPDGVRLETERFEQPRWIPARLCADHQARIDELKAKLEERVAEARKAKKALEQAKSKAAALETERNLLEIQLKDARGELQAVQTAQERRAAKLRRVQQGSRYGNLEMA